MLRSFQIWVFPNKVGGRSLLAFQLHTAEAALSFSLNTWGLPEYDSWVRLFPNRLLFLLVIIHHIRLGKLPIIWIWVLSRLQSWPLPGSVCGDCLDVGLGSREIPLRWGFIWGARGAVCHRRADWMHFEPLALCERWRPDFLLLGFFKCFLAWHSLSFKVRVPAGVRVYWNSLSWHGPWLRHRVGTRLSFLREWEIRQIRIDINFIDFLL
jgi:hypothetical protein